MTPLEALQKRRDLIADETRWTRGAYARTKGGNTIGPNERAACSFCSIGAIRRVCDAELVLHASVAFLQKAVQEQTPDPSIAAFNDTRRYDEVLAVWDRAIEMAKEQTP